jgi:flagellar assembly factor FliW
MLIRTTRFGHVEIRPDDILRFPEGLFGLADCRHWVLLADSANDAVGWLQSTSRPDLALAVVSPRRFVPQFQLRVFRSELHRIAVHDPRQAHVLVIVGKNEGGITLNLKAPLVINLEQRSGRQVVNNADVSVRHPLREQRIELRKSA